LFISFPLPGTTDIGSSVMNAMSSLDRLLGLEERRGGAEEVDICPSDEEQEEGCPAPGFMEDDLGRDQNSIYI
jgi:hypothetical protein